MEEEIIPFQISKGMVVIGSFVGEQEDDLYVWIRRFDSEEQRGKYEAVYAIRIARALDSTGVAVVGVRDFESRRSLVGTLYSLDSTKPVRTAALALEPVAPSDDKGRCR